jgi:hypothetical protein
LSGIRRQHRPAYPPSPGVGGFPRCRSVSDLASRKTHETRAHEGARFHSHFFAIAWYNVDEVRQTPLSPQVTAMLQLMALQVGRSDTAILCSLPPHITPMKRMLNYTARIPSSPPAVHCLASDGHSPQTTDLLENFMSFLQQSDMKKHLSTRSSNVSAHHNESLPTEGSRVILRDGNLITLPPPILEEQAVETPKINRTET